MWWFRRKRHPSPEAQRARQLLRQAEADLLAAKRDDRAVDEVSRQLQEFTTRNHFGPLISRALAGGGSK